MARCLWLSDAAFYHTGFASQSRKLCQVLHDDGHEVFYVNSNCGHQPFKKVVFDDGHMIPFTLLPGGVRQSYGQEVLQEYFFKYRPDVFGTLLDTFMVHPWILNHTFVGKSFFWYPTDGGWFPRDCEQVLRKYDFPVAMSKYGQEQLKRLHGINADYVPHGVDTNLFFPLSDEARFLLRQKWSSGLLSRVVRLGGNNYNYVPVNIDLNDYFVVLCVARNQPRKFMDRLVKAFALFSQRRKKVIMLMHSDPFDVSAGFSIPDLAERMGVNHLFLWTNIKFYDSLPVSEMNNIYNLADVHFLTTSGEGFGIPIIEAMACGVPNICTNYTTTKELILDNECGLGIKPVGDIDAPYPAERNYEGTVVGTMIVDRCACSIQDAAEQLCKMYDDAQLRKKFGSNGRKAAKEFYDWDTVVGKEWLKRVNTVLNK